MTYLYCSIHKPPALISFAPMNHAHAVTVEPFQFSSRQGGVAYEWSYAGGLALELFRFFSFLLLLRTACTAGTPKNFPTFCALVTFTHDVVLLICQLLVA